MLRPLTRKDLPQKTDGSSLHIPIVYMGQLKFVCDIHFGSDERCYLEDNYGISVLISECELITDYNAYKKIISALENGVKMEKVRDMNEPIGNQDRMIALKKLRHLSNEHLVELSHRVGIKAGSFHSYDELMYHLVNAINRGNQHLIHTIIEYKRFQNFKRI